MIWRTRSHLNYNTALILGINLFGLNKSKTSASYSIQLSC